MKITLGGHNNIYTSVFTVTGSVATLAISGVQGFDLTTNNLDSVWDVTQSVFFNCKRVTVAYAYVAGLPVFTYTFFSVPAGVASGDTLVITIDVPDEYATIPLLQYSASKV